MSDWGGSTNVMILLAVGDASNGVVLGVDVSERILPAVLLVSDIWEVIVDLSSTEVGVAEVDDKYLG